MSKIADLGFKWKSDERSAERWVDDNVASARSGIKHIVSELTPAIAEVLLARNDANRSPQEATVLKYARDHDQGLFDGLNGESIKVSKCGRLNDGQHRCLMVIQTNRPLVTSFVFGLKRDSRKTLDQGATRTAGHYLSMDGIKNANNIAAAAKIVLQVERHGKIRTGTDAPTKAEIMAFAVPHMEQLQKSFSYVHRKGAAKVAHLSMLAACHYLMSERDETDADLYLDAIIEGTELQKYDPAYAVRDRLMDRSLRLNTNEKLNILFQCWNKFRKGEKVVKVYYSIKKGQLLPELI